MNFQAYLILGLAVVASASPTKPAFWKGTPLDATVEKIRSSCAEDNSLACFQYKAFNFLDTILRGDYFQLPGNVEITQNGYRSNEGDVGRSDKGLEDSIEEVIKSHNVKVSLPDVGSVTLDSRSLDNEVLGINFDFSSGSSGAVEARKKSKLKKIFVPILVFILLKAITLVPFALGVLGFKAWNSLQLAFFSFVISTGIAIFQLCQKLAADSAHPHISAGPGPWDAGAVGHIAAKSLNSLDDIQMAYSKHFE